MKVLWAVSQLWHGQTERFTSTLVQAPNTAMLFMYLSVCDKGAKCPENGMSGDGV